MKNILFGIPLKSLKKGVGSGSVAGSISQKYGSADPDQNKNVMDPRHCMLSFSPELFWWAADRGTCPACPRYPGPDPLQNSAGPATSCYRAARKRGDIKDSVAHPDPSDPYVFGSPRSGAGSVSQRYGSGFFYHQAKIIRKTLIPTVLWLLFDFLSLM